jgi:hypothetical protein
MAKLKKAPTQATRRASRQGSIPKGKQQQSSRKRGEKAPVLGSDRPASKVGARPKRAPAPPPRPTKPDESRSMSTVLPAASGSAGRGDRARAVALARQSRTRARSVR